MDKNGLRARRLWLTRSCLLLLTAGNGHPLNRSNTNGSLLPNDWGGEFPVGGQTLPEQPETAGGWEAPSLKNKVSSKVSPQNRQRGTK